MTIEAKYVWLDGELIPFADAKIHLLSHTLHYGVGAFEGLRSYTQPDGRAGIWHLDLHVRRLIESSNMMRMKLRWSQEQIRQACLDILKANESTEAYLRPLVFFGMGAMGLGARSNPVHLAVCSWKWGAYLGDDGIQNGVRLQTSSFTRNHPNSALQRAKIVGHYVNSVMARYEANDNGFDEALMLDQNGYVAEGTGENIFVIRDGVALTPPLANILPGITRATMLELLKHEGIEVREQFFGRDALYTADEAFMCGSAAEVTPIRELDRRTIGDGTPGPITRAMQQLYADSVRGRVDWMRHHITLGDPPVGH
ncbi:MAG: branched-chain amino acid transaminase [Deltaproteobacteria bacterium]|nr:MAG: branched-chain amino acid transaminase [Deltaproteobacteria bacterium]